MARKRLVVLSSLFFLLVLTAGAVTTATANIVLQISNTTSTAITKPYYAPISSQALIDGGLLSSTGLNEELNDTSATSVPFMPSSGSQSPTFLFSGATNQTASNGTANALALILSPGAAQNTYYFGMGMAGRSLRINVTTPAIGTYILTWEYTPNGGITWLVLPGLVDNTDSFKTSGINSVTWDLPPSMPKATVNGSNAYWVRARVSAFTSMSQYPLGTQVLVDSAYYAGYVTALGANSITTQTLSTGLTGGEIRAANTAYLGLNGVTTADNAAMEFGSGTWKIDYSGYADTAAANVGTSLAEKPGAWKLGVTSAGNVKGVVFAAGTSAGTAQVPASDFVEGTWSTYTGCTSSTQYVCVATSGDSKSLDIATQPLPVTSYFKVGPFSNTGDATIDHVDVTMRYVSDGGNTLTVTPLLMLDGLITTGTPATTSSGAYQTNTQTLTRPGGGTWTIADLASLNGGITAQTTGAASVDFLSVSATYYGTIAASVIKAVATGSHVFDFETDGTNLSLAIDGGAATTTPKAAVPNTAFNYVWGQQGIALDHYMVYAKAYVTAATQQMWYQLITLPSPTTFTDQSGQSHTGTPSYPDIFTQLASPGPVNWIGAGGGAAVPTPTSVAILPNNQPSIAAQGGALGNFFLHFLFDMMASCSGCPAAQFYAIAFATGGIFWVYWLTHQKMGRSLLLDAITTTAAAVGFTVWGWYPSIWFAIIWAFSQFVIVAMGGRQPNISS